MGKRAVKRRPVRRALGLLLVAGGLALAGGVGYLLGLYPRAAGPGGGADVTIDVPWGASPSTVAARAEEAGAVRGALRFALYLRLSGAARRLQAGRHRVRDDWSPAEVARALAGRGLGRQVRVVHREGASRFALAAELDRLEVTSAAAFLEATEDRELLERLEISGESAEGYLFPETYMMEPGTPAESVVERLVRTFRDRVGPLLARRAEAARALGRDVDALEASLVERRQARGDPSEPRHFDGVEAVVILASIVEAETPHADERPLVAAVYLNRLRSPAFALRRLQADPTVRYGCLAEPDRAGSCRPQTNAITKAQLGDRANRYNTYVHESLPPGPVGNPSLPSIEAVLEPASSEALYFVAQPGGRHEFSVNYEDHTRAVARYREGRQ